MQVCERQRECCHELVETFFPPIHTESKDWYFLKEKWELSVAVALYVSHYYGSLQILLPSVTTAMCYFNFLLTLCFTLFMQFSLSCLSFADVFSCGRLPCQHTGNNQDQCLDQMETYFRCFCTCQFSLNILFCWLH